MKKQKYIVTSKKPKLGENDKKQYQKEMNMVLKKILNKADTM